MAVRRIIFSRRAHPPVAAMDLPGWKLHARFAEHGTVRQEVMPHFRRKSRSRPRRPGRVGVIGRIARAVAIVSALLWMAACQAAIQQQQEKKAQIHYYNATVDRDRILISTGDRVIRTRSGRPELHEPLTADDIDSTHIDENVAPDGDRQWGTQVDALIDVKSTRQRRRHDDYGVVRRGKSDRRLQLLPPQLHSGRDEIAPEMK